MTEHLKHIKNKEKFAEIVSWHKLTFKNEIRPSDIDGTFVYKGRRLMLEYKTGNADISAGQYISLEEVALKGGLVMIIHGKTVEEPDWVEVWCKDGKSYSRTKHNCDWEWLHQRIELWMNTVKYPPGYWEESKKLQSTAIVHGSSEYSKKK